MANRTELQLKLEEILGSTNVYYQPPETVKLTYPCIVYELKKISTVKADSTKYLFNKSYIVTYISKKTDDTIVTNLLSLEHSAHDRHYVKDGLYHDVFTIYF